VDSYSTFCKQFINDVKMQFLTDVSVDVCLENLIPVVLFCRTDLHDIHYFENVKVHHEEVSLQDLQVSVI
jgi:hypothetical protein